MATTVSVAKADTRYYKYVHTYVKSGPPPYYADNPYDKWEYSLIHESGDYHIDARSWYIPPGRESMLWQRAGWQAWERFISQVRASETQLGASLAESRDSLSMLAQRAGQLLKSVREVRTGKFSSAAETLGLLVPPSRVQHNWRRGLKSPGSIWLEYWLGWSPLINDISTLGSVISQDITYEQHCRGMAKSAIVDEVFTSDGAGGQILDRWQWQNYGLAYQANVTVTNPNKNLATSLGLANPLAVAWELVPLSFVIDWFVPVGAYLNRISDLYGCSTRHACVTSRGDLIYNHFNLPRDTPHSGYGKMRRVSGRSPGLPTPSVRPQMLSSLSITRAATAISLLTQGLKTLR